MKPGDLVWESDSPWRAHRESTGRLKIEGRLCVITVVVVRTPSETNRKLLKPGVMYVEYLHEDGTTGWNWSENLKLVQSHP